MRDGTEAQVCNWHLKMETKGCEQGQDAQQWRRHGQPLSPMSKLMAHPSFYLCIHGLFHFQQIFDYLQIQQLLAAMLRVIPSLTYAIVKDKSGVLRWQKTEVIPEDHIVWPELGPACSDSQKSNDEILDHYIAEVPLMPFDETKPPWDLHVLNYRTSRGESTLVLRLHHSLGDGTSFLSAFLSVATPADDPLRPVMMPGKNKSTSTAVQSSAYDRSSLRRIQRELGGSVRNLINKFGIATATLRDIGEGFLTYNGFLEDSKFPTKRPVDQHEPWIGDHSSCCFPLEDIKYIKNQIGGTVNDVICGIIYYAFQQYLETTIADDADSLRSNDVNHGVGLRPVFGAASTKRKKQTKVSSLVAINLRARRGLQNVNDMLKAKSAAPWGNRIHFMRVPVPVGKMKDPSHAIKMAKRIMDDKKSKSASALVYGCLLKHGFPKVNAKFYNQYFASSSLFMSNVVGPAERVCFSGNPMNSVSFFLYGFPQALQLTILSYVDKINVHILGLRPYVDAQLFSKFLGKAFSQAKTTMSSG